MTSIAIVGMACRFPGTADSLEGYWDLLAQGDCAICEIPQDRWSLDGFYDPRPDIPTRSYSKWGGFLRDVKSFDPAFFDLTPREAETLDPQQRLLLEVAYEATQDGTTTLQHLQDATTGVFIGASNVDYNLLQRFRADRGDILAGTGNALSIVANRVSNTLNLTGPSVVTDTACSSSVVALDTACRHLRDASCNMALVGGANVLLDPRMFITFSRAHMLSPTGRIRAFDANADGFVRGEGVGMLLLKRLDDALTDGDRIYATIEGTAINQDGGTGTITAPNPDAQVAMMQQVMARANVHPHDVTFAEAHGTGTSVGDPIEVNAIGSVFGGAQRATPLLIGSSKCNLGHLEPAAGIAGLIKAALSLSKGTLPPSIGYETPNPKIDFERHSIAVADDRCRPLPSTEGAIGLVNSFGFGGTNACALLKAHAAPSVIPASRNVAPNGPAANSVSFHGSPEQDSPMRDSRAFPISAPSEEHLRSYAHALADLLEADTAQGGQLDSFAHALATHRDHFDYRAVVICRTREELIARLRAISRDAPWPRENKTAPPEIVTGRASPQGKLAFTMTGQGGQWWAMGRELLLHNRSFRAFFETFDATFKPLSGWSVIDAMLADENESELDDAAITPAVMFAFQCGLAEIWRDAGVSPDLVVGHSFGEVTAAYLAGSISLEHVAKLVMYRGLIRGDVDRVGTMAAIGLGAEEIQLYLPKDGSVEIGGYNAPNLVTLTGEERSIDAIIATLNRDKPDIVTRKLALDFAYHSSWFEPVEELFKDNVGALKWSSPDIPVVSTVTGDLNETFDADYWWSNLRYPVHYQDGINRALGLGATTFIELGPTRTLSSMTAGCAAEQGVPVVTISTLQRRWDDSVSIATAIGELYCSGYELDWAAIHPAAQETIHLPKQPWLREKYWSVPKEAYQALKQERSHSLLGSRNNGPQQSWTQCISLETHPWLADHRINGQVVYPAAAYIEAIYEAGADHLSNHKLDIRDTTFHAALYINPGDEIELRTIVHPGTNRVEIHSRKDHVEASWELRASARILPYDAPRPNKTHFPVSVRSIETSQFYGKLSERGYDYGPRFRKLDHIRVDHQTAQALLTSLDDNECRDVVTQLPAPLLDSVFQLMLAPYLSHTEKRDAGILHLPTRIDRIAISRPLRAGCIASARVLEHGDTAKRSCSFDIEMHDGLVCATITSLHARAIPSIAKSTENAVDIYREELEPWAAPDGAQACVDPVLLIQNQSCRVVPNMACAVAEFASCSNSDKACERSVKFWTSAIQDTLWANPTLSGIVYRPVFATDGLTSPSQATVEVTRQSQELLGLGRALREVTQNTSLPRIWFIFHSAAPPSSPTQSRFDDLSHAGLSGLVRTMRMECPDHDLATITIECTGKHDEQRIAEILASQSSETEFIIDQGQVLVPRLRRINHDLKPQFIPASELPTQVGFRLNAQPASGFDSLQWHTTASAAPADDHVQVEITHTGLNFRDVVAITGALPEDAEPSSAIDALGLEFAGRIVSAGRNTSEFTVNDRVFGMARGALTWRINVPPNAVFRTPDTLSDEEAATLCSAFLTADYALNHIGRLIKGERVLIHNGTGAVGLAAIALARAAGAEIFATAGNQQKRDYLRDHGVSNVFDSRSLSFTDDILQCTNGGSVDVVLNALPGPYIDNGLACLAPYGRFLEIGKRDVYADRNVGLKSLRANQSFHVIDVAAMLTDRPEFIRHIMDGLLPRFASGELSPLPCEIFPAHRVEDAFRHFAAANHIGKIVTDQTSPNLSIRKNLTGAPVLDPDGSYIVTGGSRGMGLQVARWLRAQGAGHVVACSRGSSCVGAATDHETDISDDQNPHEFCQLDVTNENEVRRMIEQLQNSDKPLKGIIHAAVVYDDAILSDMNDAAMARVIAPKVAGALNLSQAVLEGGVDLDFFLSFSSAACVTGWPGQANYTAANAALEAITRWQRRQGLPGLCIHWGVFGDAGHVSERDAMSSYLTNAGWGMLSNGDVGKMLGTILNSDEPVVTIGAADWGALAERYPAIARSPRLSEVCQSGATTNDGGRLSLTDLTGDMVFQALRIVREQVAKVLRVDAGTLTTYETISDAGIDSLSAFELRNRLEQETNLDISLGQFVSASRFDELAELLCSIARASGDQNPSSS